MLFNSTNRSLCAPFPPPKSLYLGPWFPNVLPSFFNHINAESLAIMAFLPPSLITGVYILQYLKKKCWFIFTKSPILLKLFKIFKDEVFCRIYIACVLQAVPVHSHTFTLFVYTVLFVMLSSVVIQLYYIIHIINILSLITTGKAFCIYQTTILFLWFCESLSKLPFTSSCISCFVRPLAIFTCRWKYVSMLE